MNISRRSWHFWVYTHTYVNLPMDGCSYLRKLIWACIWFIPLTLYYIPNLLIEGVVSTFKRRSFRYPIYVTKLGLAGFQLIAAWFLLCMFVLMWQHIPPVIFTKNNKDWHLFFLLGFVAWTIVIVLSALVGLGYVIQYLVDTYQKRSTKEHKPTLLSIYIKAFKEKHCPKINIVD